jgi:hypothetical protein
MRSRLLPFLFLFAIASLAACSGPREVDEGPDLSPEEEEGQPAYETFDASPYDAEPEAQDTEIDHDVPPTLMAGEIEIPEVEGPRTVQGYRVQVFSSAEKAAADDVLDEAAGWWRVVRDDPDASAAFPNGLPADVEYHQPYYRVRLGAFEYRPEAETALRVIQRRFPDAFIVPGTVTIGGSN